MTITSFAGLRPKGKSVYGTDFIVQISPTVARWINCAGIDSPGLTSSPAIALHVVELLRKAGLALSLKSNFISYRAALSLSDSRTEQNFKGKVGHSEPSLDLVCECEMVTREEMYDFCK